MFEFHGWITIRDTYSCAMEEDEKFDLIINKIKNEIDSFGWCNGFHDIRIVNGEYQLIISGYLNHKSAEVNELFDIYNEIAKIAVGSYGILYVRDDEDQNGFDNEFSVYVMAKGNITRHKDTFLSPFVGVVEE